MMLDSCAIVRPLGHSPHPLYLHPGPASLNEELSLTAKGPGAKHLTFVSLLLPLQNGQKMVIVIVWLWLLN